jgi:hypothetical protein
VSTYRPATTSPIMNSSILIIACKLSLDLRPTQGKRRSEPALTNAGRRKRRTDNTRDTSGPCGMDSCAGVDFPGSRDRTQLQDVLGLYCPSDALHILPGAQTDGWLQWPAMSREQSYTLGPRQKELKSMQNCRVTRKMIEEVHFWYRR